MSYNRATRHPHCLLKPCRSCHLVRQSLHGESVVLRCTRSVLQLVPPAAAAVHGAFWSAEHGVGYFDMAGHFFPQMLLLGRRHICDCGSICSSHCWMENLGNASQRHHTPTAPSMSYSKDKVNSVRLDVTPSLQFNNLSSCGGEVPMVVGDAAFCASPGMLARIPPSFQAFTHKQDICLLSAAALNTQVTVTPTRLQIATDGPEVKVRGSRSCFQRFL